MTGTDYDPALIAEMGNLRRTIYFPRWCLEPFAAVSGPPGKIGSCFFFLSTQAAAGASRGDSPGAYSNKPPRAGSRQYD